MPDLANLLREPRWKDAAITELRSDLIDDTRNHSVTAGFGNRGISPFEQHQLVGCCVQRKGRERNPEQPGRRATGQPELRQ